EFHGAVRALIDGSELDPSFADGVVKYVERLELMNTFAEVGGAITSLDPRLLRAVGHVFAGWVGDARSNARKALLRDACVELAAAGDAVLDRGWDFMVRKCRARGLVLRNAAGMHAIEQRAAACVAELRTQRTQRDGAFERALADIHALVSKHPHAPRLQAARS